MGLFQQPAKAAGLQHGGGGTVKVTAAGTRALPPGVPACYNAARRGPGRGEASPQTLLRPAFLSGGSVTNWMFWVFAAVDFVAWSVRALQFRRYAGTALRLDAAPADGPEPLPRLSVVVPARNEEATVEEAMRTLLAADYPEVEVVAVDDRSTDATGAILDRLAAAHPRLRVAHVGELPPGWLGKNHALHLGAGLASGEYILFTDADVHFEPSALRRAVRAARRRGVDHLVLLPEMVLEGFWETLGVSYFAAMFLFRFLPWRVSDADSAAYVGVGAFNLVRAAAYRRAGGHAGLPMDVLDDVKLGKRLKASGARQECGWSGGLVRVRWAVGLRGIVEGLSKNAYAGLGFRPAAVAWTFAAAFLLAVWPAVGLWVGPPGARLLCAGALLGMVGMAGALRPGLSGSALYGLAFPLAAPIFCYAILRSMVCTYRHGGVVWRGTLYPLADLRKGVV